MPPSIVADVATQPAPAAEGSTFSYPSPEAQASKSAGDLFGQLQLLQRLEDPGPGERWKAIDAQGRPIAVWVVPLDQPLPDQTARRLECLPTIIHPYLATCFGVGVFDHQVVIAEEWCEQTLFGRWQEHCQQGRPGIPRAELLALLEPIATALDYLNASVHDFGGQFLPAGHCLIDARRVGFSATGQLRLQSFGLGHLLADRLRSWQQASASAPTELTAGQPAATSDQYLLAMHYSWWLTGNLPLAGSTVAEQIKHRDVGLLDVSNLPIDDRPAVLQAAAFKAADRHPSCLALVRALRGVVHRTASSYIHHCDSTLSQDPKSVIGIVGSETPSVRQRSLPAGFIAKTGAPIHQTGWPAVIVNLADGAEMVLVPEGEFLAGSTPDRTKLRKAFLSGYYIDRQPVTNAQFNEFIESADYLADRWNWGDDGAGVFDRSAHPVVWVSWDDALAYCQWSGRSLPTEHQWEKACRGIDGRLRPWGDDCPTSAPERWCCYRQEAVSRRTTPTGLYLEGVSPVGCWDMIGNVWEWCMDWHDALQRTPTYRDPVGAPIGKFRVIRGGSWSNGPALLTAGFRNHLEPSCRGATIGFRGVLNLPDLAATRSTADR